MGTKTSDLEQLVQALDDIIDKVGTAGLYETVALLKIARLDLVLKAHSFTEAEFDAALFRLRRNMDSLQQHHTRK